MTDEPTPEAGVLTPFLAPPLLSLTLLLAFVALALVVLGDGGRDRRDGRSGADSAPVNDTRARRGAPMAERFRRNWMTWYWIGLGIVLAVAAIYHARSGLFQELSTCEGRTIHRDFVFDAVAFAVAAVAYPFVIRAFSRRRAGA